MLASNQPCSTDEASLQHLTAGSKGWEGVPSRIIINILNKNKIKNKINNIRIIYCCVEPQLEVGVTFCNPKGALSWHCHCYTDSGGGKWALWHVCGYLRPCWAGRKAHASLAALHFILALASTLHYKAWGLEEGGRRTCWRQGGGIFVYNRKE